jgi:hypothetical protein
LRFDAVADFLEGPCDRIFLATGLDGFFAFAEGLFALGFVAFGEGLFALGFVAFGEGLFALGFVAFGEGLLALAAAN